MKLFLVVLGLLATSVIGRRVTIGHPSSSEDVPETFRGTNYTTVDNDTAPAVSEEALDMDALKTLLTEFTSANTGFSTADLVKKLDDLEKNIKKSITKFQGTLEQERNKLSQLSALSQQVTSLKISFTELDNRMKALAAGAENLGKPGALIPSPSGLADFSERQVALSKIYRNRGHSGSSSSAHARRMTNTALIPNSNDRFMELMSKL